jgi:hypothetical protein
MVHGKSESRRTIADWTKLPPVLYRRDLPREFADKNYPVFGLDGCAINSSSTAAVIGEPWRAMKAAHFGGHSLSTGASRRAIASCYLSGLVTRGIGRAIVANGR